MLPVNFLEAVEYSDENIVITELMETSFSKEIRIVMQGHQVMRDHLCINPVSIEVLEGIVQLSVEDESILMKKGDLSALAEDVKHHLEAFEESILRLTIFLKNEE